jgi:hypothetical protein
LGSWVWHFWPTWCRLYSGPLSQCRTGRDLKQPPDHSFTDGRRGRCEKPELQDACLYMGKLVVGWMRLYSFVS